jgi:2-succinyl-5-enolpyruvyl-6-hydroxy-3-cyclohexene-1-carboxylate synthase
VITEVQNNTQHIYDLVGLCAEYDVEKAVVSPGSRCAPLLIGFGKHPDIETISITDERSAGFIGLGLAQQSEKPVVLVCTSGTATQNFAPAVTEAFYQQVPLIVLTADRPPEWIDQWDGQTIRQKNLYIDHIKGSFVYDEDSTDVAKKALELALEGAPGPVHLNIPIREPFYPESLDDNVLTTETRRAQRKDKINKIENAVWIEFESILNSSDKVLVLGGQLEPNSQLVELLKQLDVAVTGDVISNLHGVDGVIQSSDLIFKTDNESLMPDFLITLGRSVISKNLKLCLRKHKPKTHWHIGLGMVGNPFQSLTKTVAISPEVFLKEWIEKKQKNRLATKGTEIKKKLNDKSAYFSSLLDQQKMVNEKFRSLLEESDFNYFSAVKEVIQDLPKNSILHLGNSMPVRIANFIGLNDPTIDVWCNRGTSGIDGVLSTAVGHSLAEPNRKHTLIIGDLSFFYDRNGLWLNHEFPNNLQIVILNDSGGGIFNMIPGPSSQGDLTELFTTQHQRTAKLTAKEFNMNYQGASSIEEITGWESGILEIFTDMKTNTETFRRITTKAPSQEEKQF